MISKINKWFSIPLLPFMVLGCMKEEIAVPKHTAGDAQTNEIALGQDYRNQLYFDLGSNQVVKSNLKTEWDLAFESNGTHIILNTGKGMAAHKSHLPFNEINSSEGLDWNWDAHSGNLDSTAVGNWEEDNFVYVIDRGYDWAGEHQGYFKMQILSSNEASFEVNYAELSVDAPTNYTVEKSVTAQFTYFSFESGIVSIAPSDSEYDLIFTQYTHLFTDPLTPYLVTGLLLNRDFTKVARLDEKPFEEIVLSDVGSLEFKTQLDAIGYDWKYYSLEDGVYSTYTNQHYIIQTQDGFFYKLRIVGFYNAEGLKGYPNIEFQAL